MRNWELGMRNEFERDDQLQIMSNTARHPDATSRCRVEFEPEEVAAFEKALGIDNSVRRA